MIKNKKSIFFIFNEAKVLLKSCIKDKKQIIYLNI